MSGMKINFAEVESSFEPLPEGQYDCIIDRVEVRESNSSEHNYLNWELSVQDDDYEGRKLWMITSLSPRALFRLKDVLMALGVIEDDDEIEIEWDDEIDVSPKEGPQVIEPELDGIACVAVVTNEMYDGRERNRVNDLIAASGTTRKQSSNGSDKKPTAKKAPAKKAGARRKLR